MAGFSQEPGPVMHTHPHKQTYAHTQMTKSLVWAPTHSDLMKLSWFEMNWEEGYGLLSLRTVQMPSGSESGWLETESWRATYRGIPESSHPLERIRCLWTGQRMRGKEGTRLLPEAFDSDPLNINCFLTLHQGFQFPMSWQSTPLSPVLHSESSLTPGKGVKSRNSTLKAEWKQ